MYLHQRVRLFDPLVFDDAEDLHRFASVERHIQHGVGHRGAQIIADEGLGPNLNALDAQLARAAT